ncbi:hypothetical protein AL035_11335 [Salipiger aestuarii]|uniref:CENP-V/GFA domain-containing protein n=1 Tax=Salipiger aestuarii TaxID=568098 RepID=A0A327Y114_9RHOB|nr:DUF6151 family protein [Salipiger aestuarii]EIE51981.1 hypothetical protein C357_05867 [Citreicella sp. 357]KAB2541645.1 hypothetical protein AL035_11335 [Salipiger aestuarii]RAK14908.1 hypothetical protein ATI53_102739 [Salipiger aestuarii]
MSDHRALACRCGTLRWRVADRAPGALVICHCADCQAAAHALGAEDALDDAGGTALFQTLPDQIEITAGADRLALLRLSPKGLLRWHAGCCGTPVANTLPKPLMPFVGIVVPHGRKDFGKTRARVFTESARRPVKQHGFGAAGAGIMLRALTALAQGRRDTPFFGPDGAPVRGARILSATERKTGARVLS